MERTTNEIEDQLLVIRCQRGDQAAWNALILRWNKRLMYFIRRLIDSEHDAANILQEAWLNVFRSLPKLRDETRLAPWMYQIARRCVLRHLRSAYSRIEEQHDEIIDTVADPRDILNDIGDNIEVVHLTLHKIPLPYREALTLYFLQDLSIAEIAEVLGIPPGTVKSRLFSARQSFRNILDKENQ